MSSPTGTNTRPPEPLTAALDGERREPLRRGRLFGRYHEVMLLVLGFLLTTVVGGIVGAKLQRRESERLMETSMAQARRQWRAQQDQAGLDKASSVRERLARLLDSRMLCMRQLADDYKSSGTPPQRLLTHEREYGKVFRDWNENLNLNVFLVEEYFGGKLRKQFENEVLPEFARIHIQLKKAKDGEGSVEKRLESLRRKIYLFNQDLTTSLQERRAAINK